MYSIETENARRRQAEEAKQRERDREVKEREAAWQEQEQRAAQAHAEAMRLFGQRLYVAAATSFGVPFGVIGKHSAAVNGLVAAWEAAAPKAAKRTTSEPGVPRLTAKIGRSTVTCPDVLHVFPNDQNIVVKRACQRALDEQVAVDDIMWELTGKP